MDGAPQNQNGSCDVNTPLQGRFVVRVLGLATTNLCTKFIISTLTHFKDMEGDEKCKDLGGLGG